MKLEHAKLTVVLLTVGGLLFVAAQAVFLIVPTYRDVVDLGQKIIAANDEVQAQYTNRKNLLAATTQIQDAQKIVSDLDAQFVAHGSELGFITALEGVADKNGVSLSKTLVSGSGAYPEFDRGVDMTINGRYQDVLRSIVDIERLPALVSISGYSIVGGGGTGDQATLSVTMHGTIAAPPKGL